MDLLFLVYKVKISKATSSNFDFDTSTFSDKLSTKQLTIEKGREFSYEKNKNLVSLKNTLKLVQNRMNFKRGQNVYFKIPNLRF